MMTHGQSRNRGTDQERSRRHGHRGLQPGDV